MRRPCLSVPFRGYAGVLARGVPNEVDSWDGFASGLVGW